MTDHNEVADVLDGAADVIERDGWHQGDFYPGHQGYVWDGGGEGLPKCARAAVYAAGAVGICQHEAAMRALAAAAGRDLWWTIATWNDAPERTEQEVLDAFRKAAKHERAAADGIDLGGAA